MLADANSYKALALFIISQWSGHHHISLSSEQVAVAQEIIVASWQQGLPPEQTLLIGYRESQFHWNKVRINAPGHGTDWGAMQVNDLWTPVIRSQTEIERIGTGVTILKVFLGKCGGDWRCAHRAYATGHVHLPLASPQWTVRQ